MLATLAYLRAHPAEGATRKGWLIVAWLCFAVALLFKAVAATLPAVLLILDVYPLRRLGPGRWLDRRVWAEKLPFVGLGATFMGIALRARMTSKSLVPVEQYGIASRLAQACHGACFYLAKTVWPSGLSIYYAMPERVDPFAWPFWPSILAVAVASVGVLLMCRRRPALLAAWAAYLAILAPNLGLVRVAALIAAGQYSAVSAADRYGYLATIPLAALFAGGLARLLVRRGRGLVAVGVLGVALALSALSWEQCRTWRSSEVLLRTALARRGSRSPEIRVNLGAALFRAGKLEEGATECEEALRLAPGNFQAHYNLGVIRARQGRLGVAIAQLDAAVKLEPDDPFAHHDLAVYLAR
jgi:tetratricopeptide (TPR) repeat protein